MIRDLEDISTDLTRTSASIKLYQETGFDKYRQEALEHAPRLVRSLEKPADAIYKLFLQPSVLMAVKTAHDLGIFTMLSQTNSFVTCGQMAALKSELCVSLYATASPKSEFMEGTRANTPHWADWFPVQERILDGALTDRPLLVDIGGGRGHDLAGFKDRFPSVTGKLILEDLPPVIEDIQDLSKDIRRIKHDFFIPQPIKGWSAFTVFLPSFIVWPFTRRILNHITAAMEKGYSKLLLEDYIVPDQNAGARETLLDMTVMIWCPGIERTRRQWTELLESVGLVIRNFWLPEGCQGRYRSRTPRRKRYLTWGFGD
ncbi:S-adenosyl-L-methionine-dependent methyltransferase [Aspergillus vadensis CBS 113365]|uniref:S-adenosyl-L-methionine-dependent methyltransferase n=1 Tax=Aspergillus vadensis (strain CBS 113365 / IMI 142717 / IBT 24658) TaxID=1448311 RepID=A0A319BE45_ASPVC|nr:S-adenosyl-L-methionine-dependent methyltransferase [Aspergillus vadensis CBS 113365]PYH64193.1 S-adenosyl-L-methionine-dependent methyltransferase [Aspergillus vadensis CBS 113365]